MDEPFSPDHPAHAAVEIVYHVTVVSNFARAFDKYSRRYDKRAIAESTFADKFFVLRRDELHIGIAKARTLLDKLGLAGNDLLVLETQLAPELLHPNMRTGKGRYLEGTSVFVRTVHWVDAQGNLAETSVEEAYARSLACLQPELVQSAYAAPRSFSVLPIARACQASCRFCFSESSVSLGQSARVVDLARVEPWLRAAVDAGAERFVITGGGEPGLLKHPSMVDLMVLASRHFKKLVLITNGYHLAKQNGEDRSHMVCDYVEAGLSVLAVSRHHWDAQVNAGIMGLDTGSEKVALSVRAAASVGYELTLRFICVLQKGGVQTAQDIEQYLRWASAQGAEEVCFKELYVSTTLESAYHARPENAWSHANQVPLSVLTACMPALGFVKAGELPWGAPYYEGEIEGRRLRVAAYTEPSLYWERSNGIARSWNLMADGTCLASLEDPTSVVPLPGVPARRVIPVVSA